MTSPQFCSSSYGAAGMTSLNFVPVFSFSSFLLYGTTGVNSLKFCFSLLTATGVTSL